MECLINAKELGGKEVVVVWLVDEGPVRARAMEVFPEVFLTEVALFHNLNDKRIIKV